MMNKETIKQFLKPDWRKIIIFVVLTCVLLIHLWLSAIIGVETGPQIIDFFGIILNIVPIVLLGFSYYASLILNVIPELSFPFFIFITIIIPVLWYYFLSCLIIFAFDKFRKRK